MALDTTQRAQPPLTPEAELHAIPNPMLEEVVNRTPFIETHSRCMGPRRIFHDVIVVKGTFDLDANPLMASVEQIGHQLCDEYWDGAHPEISSLKLSDDLELYKPGTDVLVVGTVHSLEGKPRKEWGGMLRVARGKEVLIQKTLRFTGPRRWQHGLLRGWTLSDPEPATAVPLRYELAYGGWWLDPKEKDPDLARQVYLPNPSGSGYFGKSHDTAKTYPGPQVELHPKIIDAGNYDYTPGGFGPIARFWQPRVKYAGTYDDAWFQQFHDSTIPDYPADFDLRFFQAAPPDQVTSTHLRGGELLQLAGLFGDTQGLVVQLPTFGLTATLETNEDGTQSADLQLDTVTADLDSKKLCLLWRLALPHSAGARHATIDINPHSSLQVP